MTYVDVWRLETAWDEDVNTNWYELGLLLPDQSRPLLPSAGVQVHELEAIGTAVTLTLGNKPNDRTSFKCTAVNAEPFKWMLGNDEGAGVWSPQLTGRKPSIALYKADDYLKYRARGIKLTQLNWSLEADAGGLLTYIGSGIGGTHGAYAPAVTNSGYYGTLQTPIGFKPTFTWNGSGLEILKIGGTIQQKLTPLMGPSGYYQDIMENASMHFGINVMFKQNQDISAVSTDRYAGTSRAFVIKLYRDATHYIQLGGSALCADVIEATTQGKPTVYTGQFVCDGTTKMTDVLS
jgi:hypothetical protein